MNGAGKRVKEKERRRQIIKIGAMLNFPVSVVFGKKIVINLKKEQAKTSQKNVSKKS